MRKNRWTLVLAAAAMSGAVLSGCGQLRGSTEPETEAATESKTPAVSPVQVQETEPESEPETQKLITSVEYTSKDGTVKITLPDNTWKVTQDADEMRVFSSGSDAMINIVHASTDSAMKTLSIQKTEEELKAALTKQYSDTNAYDIEKFEARKVNNVDTYRYEVKYNAAARMWAYSVTYGIVAPDQAYVITGTVTEDNAALLKAVEDSVDSFTVLKDEELKSVTDSTLQGTTTTGQTAAANTTSNQETSSLSQYGAATTMYVTDIVNVRSGPGTDTDVISGYSTGDAILVTGETANWYQVSINGTTGYIRKDFVSSAQTASTSAQADTSNAEASAESSTAYNYGTASTMYATDGVNIRSGPSTDSGISGTLGAGTSVSVIGETDNWFIVSTGGGTGYISKSYLSSSQPTSAASSDSSGSSGASSGAASGGTGSISGTVTSASGSSITVAGDDGNTYVIYTGDADIVTSNGLYAGVYVNATVDNSQTASDGTRYATNVTG